MFRLSKSSGCSHQPITHSISFSTCISDSLDTEQLMMSSALKLSKKAVMATRR